MRMLIALLLMAGVAYAGETPRVWSIADAREHLAKNPKGEVKINKEMTVKQATFYGCAFASKKAWEALTIDDGTTTLTVYRSRKLPTVKPEKEPEGIARILMAQLRLPAKKGKCAVEQYELVNY